MIRLQIHGFIFATALGLGTTVSAAVKMPAIFGDHMVLQQGTYLPVWGTAEPGEKVTVSIGDRQAGTTADLTGRWIVRLDPFSGQREALKLTVKGTNTLTFQDVLIGEVWVCSGQSNMEWPLRNTAGGEEAVATADLPEIRVFMVTHRVAHEPQDDCIGTWKVCSPGEKELLSFSAVGFFFGRELHRTLRRPIGLIQTTWGGTPAQSWTSLSALQGAERHAHYASQFTDTMANLPALRQEYPKILADWEKKKNEALAASPPLPVPRQPVFKGDDPKLPTGLFNGMVNPLLPYSIKGVIWYQGEANADNETEAREYATLFSLMIQDWRSRWEEGNFPFLYVQLAGFSPGREWPALRQSQLEVLRVPNVGMAVAYDLGERENIHPRNKLDVALRLALNARYIAYGEALGYSGPLYESMQVEEDKIRVRFKHTDGGLKAGGPAGTGLRGFEIASADGEFVPAQAVIEGGTVTVSADGVKEPHAVRLGWSPFPDANLYNGENLPASPFSTRPASPPRR